MQPGESSYTRFVYSDDVKQAKRRVDAKYQGLNTDVHACAAITDGEKATWNDLFTAWRKLYCRSDSTTCTEPDASIWGAGGQMDDVERYEKNLFDWQSKLATKCAVSAPIVKPDVVKREEDEKKPSDMLSTVKYVAIGLGVVAVVVSGAVIVSQVAPIVRRVVPTRRDATA